MMRSLFFFGPYRMSTDPSPTQETKDFFWGDDEDDDFLAGEGDGPEEGRFETAPDEQGIKTITDIQIRDGKKFKTTKRVRVVKRTVKINMRAEERIKNWVRFGKAKENTIDITVKEQDLPFDISGKRKITQSSVEKKIDEEIVKMMRQSATGGDPEAKYVPRSLRPGGRPAPEPKPAPGAEPQGNAYRPPSMRDGSGAGGRSMATREDNAHTVRVTNLSEEITEQDLKDLFGAYGPLQRVFLARERTTRESKGFAFINFFNKADAEKAIEKVSGFGYNHLILQVEWAKPSGN
mmetsp:Transcript_2593/g.4823  ORF Transcript_2593/g.4823 Transcript_2593/m.4823 type:complete len:292 (+) Transcript_2593:3-878(+)